MEQASAGDATTIGSNVDALEDASSSRYVAIG